MAPMRLSFFFRMLGRLTHAFEAQAFRILSQARVPYSSQFLPQLFADTEQKIATHRTSKDVYALCQDDGRHFERITFG